LLACGIRYSEALTVNNLVIQLSNRGKLDEYYHDQMLEHYKYPEMFIRRTKKLFLSFCPREVIEKITKSEKLTHYAVKMRLQRKKVPLRFGDIREYWASIMTRYLSQPEINFLQGRVSSSVFMVNYFNPMLINDLKQRCLKGINDLLNY